MGLSSSDPYNHAFMGMQIAKPLYINLRQSMQISSVSEKPEMVYPGMDIKLRLGEEGRYAPAVVFGMNSALGHMRQSSEYFALSKRYYDFDFTAGVGWGRLGSTGHIRNPLVRVSNHFDHNRDFNNHDPAGPNEWFTGEEIGFFGGVEYFTPVTGLSLKADFNADAYRGEQQAFGFERSSPWSIGFNYSPKEWVSFGASVLGLDTVMARLTLQTNIHDWKVKSYKPTTNTNFAPTKEKHWYDFLVPDIQTAPTPLLTKIGGNKTDISGVLHLNNHEPSAQQIGRAARYLSKQNPKAATVTIVPVTKGLRGQEVRFSRRDLEMAQSGKGSPEEIWQDTEFSANDRSIGRKSGPKVITFAPELALSLGEEETTHLYRTGLVAEASKALGHGFVTGGALRLNIADNLHRLAKFRTINHNSIRSDADLFTANRINVERTFIGFLKTPLPDFHLALTAGYLEEMYAGVGGEVLYRPFGSPFSVGAELWRLYKRDGTSPLALGYTGEAATSGFLNINYEIPDTDITAFAKVGRFIGGDVGINTGAQMQFDSGLKVKGYVSITDSDDKDVFGGDRNVFAGLQMSIPLGSIPYIPQGTEGRVKIAPIGRDDAAMLDKPIDLYEVTEPVSYRHLGRNWQGVLD